MNPTVEIFHGSSAYYIYIIKADYPDYSFPTRSYAVFVFPTFICCFHVCLQSEKSSFVFPPKNGNEQTDRIIRIILNLHGLWRFEEISSLNLTLLGDLTTKKELQRFYHELHFSKLLVFKSFPFCFYVERVLPPSFIIISRSRLLIIINQSTPSSKVLVSKFSINWKKRFVKSQILDQNMCEPQ